jgi:hypothetical protein
MSKILTFAATGLVGVVLGAGIGVAAAGQDSDPATTERSAIIESMDEMHASMRAEMPTELVEECDQMHATMAEHMSDGDHAAMMESMGSMMSGMGSDMSNNHTDHHPEKKD